MKVYISNYRNHWISPYTILEKIFFWREIDYDEPIIDKWSSRLEPISIALQKFLNFIYPEIKYVKVDYYDTWSFDHTLTPIILPMLKQLRDTKHGSPMVDVEDLPEELRIEARKEWSPQLELKFEDDETYDKDSWGLIHRQWDWVMNEMIFAFEHLNDTSWEDTFCSGEIDHVWVNIDMNGKENLDGEYRSLRDGPNHTYKCDYDGMNAVYVRIDNGLRLFGKYYRNLWD